MRNYVALLEMWMKLLILLILNVAPRVELQIKDLNRILNQVNCTQSPRKNSDFLIIREA